MNITTLLKAKKTIYTMGFFSKILVKTQSHILRLPRDASSSDSGNEMQMSRRFQCYHHHRISSLIIVCLPSIHILLHFSRTEKLGLLQISVPCIVGTDFFEDLASLSKKPKKPRGEIRWVQIGGDLVKPDSYTICTRGMDENRECWPIFGHYKSVFC